MGTLLRNSRDHRRALDRILTVVPSFAADVTPDRLVNADKEPQNWLMNHRTYDAQHARPPPILRASIRAVGLFTTTNPVAADRSTACPAADRSTGRRASA